MTITRSAAGLVLCALSIAAFGQSVTDGRPSLTTDLELPATGEYQLSVQDTEFPQAFAALDTAILDGSTIVASLDAPGVVTFEAATTSLTLRVFAQTATPQVVGTVSISVTSTAANETVFTLLEALENEQPDGPGVSEAMTFTLASPQLVTVALSDFAVPVSLTALDVIVLDSDGQEAARFSGPGATEVSLPAGEYRLFSAATADEMQAAGNGLFRIEVDGATSGTLIDDLNVFGDDISLQAVTLAGGPVTLSATDVGFPAALDELSAVLVGPDASLSATLVDGSAQATLPAGAYQLFVYGAAADDAGGTYAVDVSEDGASVVQAVSVVAQNEQTGPRFTQELEVTTAGTYQLAVTDFRFPAALTALSTVVVGPTGLVATLSGDGVVNFDAEPGAYQVLVAAAAGADQDGLFGVTLTDPAGAVIVESTGGTATGGEVGEISAQAGERITVAVSDLGFPAQFANLSLAVTRGNETVGFVFGAGSFFFDVTESGTYRYTLLATPDAEAGAGLYDIDVSRAATPPAPPPTPPAPPPTPPNDGGSGGGGALGVWMMLALWCRRRSSALQPTKFAHGISRP